MPNFIDKLALIYLKDKKILSSRTKGKDTWYIPGGKRENGESDHQALTREIKEELGVDIDESTIKPFGIFEAQAHNHPEGMVVRMTCYTAEVIGRMGASSEIEEIKFFNYADDFKKSPVDQLIFDNLKKKGLLI